MKSLAPNTLLQNRYLVVHLIGKGGMGDVYLAVDQRLGSAVALKRTFFSDDEMFGNAFEREAKTLARLRHGVLPKVSDHFSENDVQFLVMEHISGDDLAKRLESAQKPFPLSWVLFWADQLLDALAYLHSHEPPIIHRDIKPQNLKLTDENSIILLDFGLSKNTEGDTRAILSGSTGSVVGYTPHYAPMEQIRGTGTNPRSDIYALSATLYQLLTNTIPFDSLTRADALLNGLNDPIKPINEINPEVPQTVSAVILKGMELSQDKRFQNAREMQKALREAFVQIQNSMTAQTVALNIQSEQLAQSFLPGSATLNITNSQLEENSLNSIPLNCNSVAQSKTSDSPADSNASEEENFVETIRQDANFANQQSGIKTEMFAQNSSAPNLPQNFEKISADSESARGKNSNENKNSFVKKDAGDIKSKFDPAVNAAKAVSAASIRNPASNYIQKPADDSEIKTSPRIEQESDAFATYTPALDYQSEQRKNEKNEENEKNEQSERNYVQAQSAQKKSANAKSFVSGAVAVLLLILAASGGWFVYNNYAEKKAENPIAQPPLSEMPPTPAPTAETIAETNLQNDSQNNSQNKANPEVVSSDTSNQTNSELNNSSNSTPNSASNPAIQQTPSASTRTPPQQTSAKNKPKTSSAPTDKPAGKPAEKKPAAPIILQ